MSIVTYNQIFLIIAMYHTLVGIVTNDRRLVKVSVSIGWVGVITLLLVTR